MIGSTKKVKPNPEIYKHIQNQNTTFSDIKSLSPHLISLADQEFSAVHDFLELKEKHLIDSFDFESLIKRLHMMRTQIISREGKHQKDLTKLAVSVISEIYDIPEDQINWDVKFSLEGLIDPSFEEEELEIEPDRIPFVLKEIKKRKILNAFVHGSSMHIWKSCHHLVGDKLKKISPVLPILYDSYTSILGFCIWQNTPNGLEQGFNEGSLMTQGINRITFDEEETPNIEVEAVNFPSMLHEVNKGAMDLIICHGIPEDVTEGELKYIYSKADRYQDEFWHYLISPSLWSRLLKSLNTGTENIPEILMEISLLDLEQLETIMRALGEDSNRTIKILNSYGIAN